MRVLKATESTVFYIETDEDEYNCYIRHSADNWEVTMGESREQVYECEELEKAFQFHLLNNPKSDIVKDES